MMIIIIIIVTVMITIPIIISNMEIPVVARHIKFAGLSRTGN